MPGRASAGSRDGKRVAASATPDSRTTVLRRSDCYQLAWITFSCRAARSAHPAFPAPAVCRGRVFSAQLRRKQPRACGGCLVLWKL